MWHMISKIAARSIVREMARFDTPAYTGQYTDVNAFLAAPAVGDDSAGRIANAAEKAKIQDLLNIESMGQNQWQQLYDTLKVGEQRQGTTNPAVSQAAMN